jgi:carboxymethylenebutenolidase
MSFYRGMTCENVTIKGDKGTPITAYVARPRVGPFPGVVLIHHLPGWSEFYIETTRRFAHHGYLAICANLYEREGGGSDGNPDDVAAKVRAEGGIADSQMVGDTEAAVKWMRAQPDHNGKVGLIGSCSGGRHAFIYACQRKDVDACVEQWGGRVVMSKEELNAKTPVAPIDMTKDLCCPLLGLFGNDDRAPSPEQVNQHEAELKKHGKTMSSTATTAPATASSTGTGRSTGPSRQWMAGARYSRSSASIWRSRRFAYVHVHHRDRTRGGHGEARGRMVPAIAGGGCL